MTHLDEIRARSESLDRNGPGIDHKDLNKAITLAKEDVPRLLAAVDAVLELAEQAENATLNSPARMFGGKPFPATIFADDLRRAITEAVGS